MERIGEFIKAARLKAGMSQKQLGQKANIAQSTISKIEKSSKNPRYETIKKIASTLNISVDVLSGGLETTGDKIRATRIMKNLTQEDVGKKLGLSKSEIDQFEQSDCDLTLKTLQKIADALDTDIHNLI